MTNIVPFRRRAVSDPSLMNSDGKLAAAATGRLGAARVRPPEGQDDIRRTIILLDLALQHAREIFGLVRGEQERRIYDRHLASIELSLRIARERAAL
ncbi:hypothetical protein ACQR1I_08575 [Bradyrhizobium sp. HKCCYLS2038]|uniref:hypothetical protein n=1 Tax=unclassified Bradyrhizobium TaxID=2631580 RepID=UPI003EB8CA9E